MDQTIVILFSVALGLIFGGISVYFISRSTQKALIAGQKNAQDQIERKESEVKQLNQTVQDLSTQLGLATARSEGLQKAIDDKQIESDSRIAEIRDSEKQKSDEMLAEKEKHLRDQMAEKDKSIRDQLALKDKEIETEKAMIQEAEIQLKDAFKLLSEEALKNANEALIKAAKDTIENSQKDAKLDLQRRQEQIEEMLKPLKESMETLDKRIIENEKQSHSGQKLIEDHVRGLQTATDNLTSVLKRPVARGSWGEATLKNILERSGLVENVDYILQHSTNDEGRILRADAVINMTNGQKLVIDSKNLWENYSRAMQATDEETREAEFVLHANALRREIKSLKEKDYSKQYPGLNGVLLFLPFEGMYQVAMERDLTLIQYAHDNNVYLSSPVTIMGVLHAIRFVLDQEKLNKNADEISKIGKNLYDGLVTFAGLFTKVGEQLEKTMKSYNDSVGSMEKSVISRARRIRELGVGSVSTLSSPELIDLNIRDLKTELKSESDDGTTDSDDIIEDTTTYSNTSSTFTL